MMEICCIIHKRTIHGEKNYMNQDFSSPLIPLCLPKFTFVTWTKLRKMVEAFNYAKEGFQKDGGLTEFEKVPLEYHSMLG